MTDVINTNKDVRQVSVNGAVYRYCYSRDLDGVLDELKAKNIPQIVIMVSIPTGFVQNP
jgi:hypothetical protein